MGPAQTQGLEEVSTLSVGEFHRGVPVEANSDIVKYLTGALAVKDKDNATRLRFFFDYLDNADPEIAGDAYLEFAKADPKDTRAMVKALPAAKPASCACWNSLKMKCCAASRS